MITKSLNRVFYFKISHTENILTIAAIMFIKMPINASIKLPDGTEMQEIKIISGYYRTELFYKKLHPIFIPI